MENFIYNLMEQINGYPQWCVYLFTYISGWIQVIFPPYPGEVILVLNGCIHAGNPVLLCFSYFFAYWLSIVSANFALYELGKCKGNAILVSKFFTRIFNKGNSEKIKGWLAKRGFLVYILAIYIPGIFLPLVFFSGVMKCKRHVVLTGIMLATLVHDIMLFLGGKAIGSNLKSITAFISAYKGISIGIIAGIAVGLTVFFIVRNRNSDVHEDIGLPWIKNPDP
jgi:Uncharacterized membrane-associated protein